MRLSFYFALLAALTLAGASAARTLSLELKNGDRVSGDIVAENTNHLVLSNQWTATLEIPIAQIQKRSEAPSPATPLPVTVVIQTPPAAPPKPNDWKLEAEIGLNAAYGSHEKQNYFGKARVGYIHPYLDDPQQSTRLSLQYSAQYGRTDRELSDNKMEGFLDSEFDLNRRFFIDNEARVGYDQIRKIDLRYEIGPGLGYHWLQRPTMKLNTITGFMYQAQHGHDGATEHGLYWRLAEEFSWQISQRITLDEKLDYFPLVSNPDKFRARLEINLRYKLLQNLSLNLTLQDFYDSHPADNVSRNELEIRSSLGIAF